MMRCRLSRTMPVLVPGQDIKPGVTPKFEDQDAGFLIDDPGCWRLVQMGVAVPDDDECRERAGMTDEQMEEASEKYDKLERGQSIGDPRYDALDVPAVEEPDDELDALFDE